MFVPNEAIAFAAGVAATLGATRLRLLRLRRHPVADGTAPAVALAPELETQVDEAARRWAEASGHPFAARVAGPFAKELLRMQPAGRGEPERAEREGELR